MVRVYGATFGDVTDRPTRQIGIINGLDELYNLPEELRFSKPLGLMSSSLPWSSHYPWGRVLMLDDFEGTLKWNTVAGAITKASDATFVHSGSSAMKMVTSGAAGSPATADIFVGPVIRQSTYLAVEFWWALSAAVDTTPRDFWMVWTIEDKILNTSTRFGVRFYNYDATVLKRKLQLWNNAGVWTDIAGAGYRTSIVDSMFNYWCLVLKRVPVIGYSYEYFKMNGYEVLLMGTPGQVGSYAIPRQNVMIQCTTDIAAVTTAYVDDFTIMDAVRAHVP